MEDHKITSIQQKGLVFLLGYSALAALLNYLTSRPVAAESSDPSPWLQALGWGLIILFYLPAYIALSHSVRNWRWSLEEWGFGLTGRNWLAIGTAALALLLVWLPLPPLQLGQVQIGDFGSLREAANQGGIPLQLFGGYARVAEELLYRGFALILFRRIFARRRSNWLWAILLSSIIFALVHTHRPADMLQLFLGTAVPLAAWTLWTRSISTAFVLHAIAGGGPVGGLLAALIFGGVAATGVIKRNRGERVIVNSRG